MSWINREPSAAGRVHYITWQLPAPEVNDCCLLRSSCQVESSHGVFLPKLAAGELWRVEKEVRVERKKGKPFSFKAAKITSVPLH